MRTGMPSNNAGIWLGSGTIEPQLNCWSVQTNSLSILCYVSTQHLLVDYWPNRSRYLNLLLLRFTLTHEVWRQAKSLPHCCRQKRNMHCVNVSTIPQSNVMNTLSSFPHSSPGDHCYIQNRSTQLHPQSGWYGRVIRRNQCYLRKFQPASLMITGCCFLSHSSPTFSNYYNTDYVNDFHPITNGSTKASSSCKSFP